MSRYVKVFIDGCMVRKNSECWLYRVAGNSIHPSYICGKQPRKHAFICIMHTNTELIMQIHRPIRGLSRTELGNGYIGYLTRYGHGREIRPRKAPLHVRQGARKHAQGPADRDPVREGPVCKGDNVSPRGCRHQVHAVGSERYAGRHRNRGIPKCEDLGNPAHPQGRVSQPESPAKKEKMNRRIRTRHGVYFILPLLSTRGKE